MVKYKLDSYVKFAFGPRWGRNRSSRGLTMIKREKTAVEAAVHPYKTRSGGATVTVFVP